MILVDLNQITFSNLAVLISKGTIVDNDTMRYMVLNSIRAYNAKLFKGWGEVVIACDSKHNWRKDVFPFYKARRKKRRKEETKINWEKVFGAFDVVKSELKEFFPYTVIDVDKAEADDIVGTLCKTGERTLILSGDSDFIQLHDGFLISQYNPVKKKFISNNDPVKYLKEHIIEGDAGDDVPNVLSADDTFIMDKRQKRLTSKKFKYLMENDPENYPSVEKRNFFRNKQLIDLSCTPKNIMQAINDQYQNKPVKDKSKLFNYFYDRKLTKFIDSIQEF